MKTLHKRFAAIFAAAFILIASLFFPVPVLAGAAENDDVKFDETDVLDDLQSIEGFSLAQYPFNELADPEISVIDFVEYCYDYHANMRENYGLYLYVYNPTGKNIVTNSAKNQVEIAVAYDSDPITEKSNAVKWDKFGLKFCSVSSQPGVNRLFYKFKVIDEKGADGKTIAERVNSMDRRYDISGLELLTEGNPNATDYKVGTEYHFSGFAENYGSGSMRTPLKRKTIQTIEISLSHKNAEGEEVKNFTAYRYPYLNDKNNVFGGHQNQITSVYFAIPKGFNEKYGELYRVTCSWNEQKTAPIIVTNRQDVYDEVAKNLGTNGSGASLGIIDSYVAMDDDFGNVHYFGNWAFNKDLFYSAYFMQWYKELIIDAPDEPYAGYAFKTDKANVKEAYISPTQVLQWIYGHDGADYLFLDSVDEGQTKGYQKRTFTADEPFNPLSYNQSASDREKFSVNWLMFWTGRWSWDLGPEQVDPVDPIEFVEDTDFTGTDAADASKLYVHTDDFAEFKDFYNANKAGNNVFLLRFALRDYYSNIAFVCDNGIPGLSHDEESTYISQETVFLDFDIIEFTFLRDTTETVIPVVSSPIDIVPGVDPPISEDGISWGKVILAVLLLILLVILLWPILPYLIKAVIWIITLPFKLIGMIVKGVKSSAKKRRHNDKE